MSQVLEKVNKEIISYGLSIAEKVGTTTSVLLIFNNNFYIVHVGDSRIYRLNRQLEQLTEDHTYVAMSVKKNLMTKEEQRIAIAETCTPQSDRPCAGLLAVGREQHILNTKLDEEL